MDGKFSSTIMAEARVVRASGAYLGLETNVTWPGIAVSIVAMPNISTSASAGSSRAPIRLANSQRFINSVKANHKHYHALICGISGNVVFLRALSGLCGGM